MTDLSLKLARDFALPLEIATEASAIVATRGAGKSSASSVITEEVFALGVQVVIFDRTGVYWGLRSNGKGDGPGLAVELRKRISELERQVAEASANDVAERELRSRASDGYGVWKVRHEFGTPAGG